jgi:hypothetical protein
MNEEDKKRFARYRSGFIEPNSEDEEPNPTTKIGFIEDVNINQESLVNEVLKELESKKQLKNKMNTSTSK